MTSLIQLATEARGTEWAQELSGALSACATAGWTWEKAFLAATRLIIDPQATPRELLREVQDPTKRPVSAPPTEAFRAELAALHERPRAGREPVAPVQAPTDGTEAAEAGDAS